MRQLCLDWYRCRSLTCRLFASPPARTAVILIFLSRAYVTSANCLRELTAATELRKPLIVVYEPEDGHGGGSPKELLQGCPADLRTSLEQHSFIRWAIKPDLQLIALTLVCSRPLLYFEANLLAVAYRVAHVNSIS